MAMIKSHHRPFFTWFFRIYSKQMIRWHFRKLTIHAELNDLDLPVLMIGNHFSWWDGFIANLITHEMFHRKFHVMMLEEQLANRMFLNKAGAYSIKKGSRSVIDSVQYTMDLLRDKENLVVIYPQGEFGSVYQSPLRFEKGIGTILSRVQNNFRLVFYAALVDYFSFRKPSLDIYLYEVPQGSGFNSPDLEKAYNDFYVKCIKRQKPA